MKKKEKEYLISEIVIQSSENENVDLKITDLKNKIEVNGFENVAKSFSISKSSLNGGDLGWLKESVISKKIKSIIINTSVGNISEPLILPEGILIFKVRNKREVENNISLEDRKNQLVLIEKNKILNMHSSSHYDKIRRSIAIKFLQ